MPILLLFQQRMCLIAPLKRKDQIRSGLPMGRILRREAVGCIGASVLDLSSRRIVGWAMAASQDETLVEQALSMAITHRKPEEGLLHHSDRGCQYTSHAYQTFLKDHGIRVSMSRKGNCWDNAVMERFFGTLTREYTHAQHALLPMRRPARPSLSTSRFTTTGCASTLLWAISARFSLS